MEVIENNYKESVEVECPYCKSKLKYEPSDIYDRDSNPHIVCPCCHYALYFAAEIPNEESFTLECDECKTTFNAPAHIGLNGDKYETCPNCGNEVWADIGIRLDSQNIEYPLHFYHYNNTKAKKANNEEIQKWVRECVESVEKGEEYTWSGSGDTLVIAFKTEEDTIVFVCKGYSECCFPNKN